MTKKIKKLMTIAILLLVNQFSFAGATEDLWIAIKTANYPNALTAIAAGADMKNMDPSFGTPLNLASCWADAEVVKALIDAGSDINFVMPSNKFTPLMNAAYWGNTEAVKLLLAAGSNIKVVNIIGQTLLATAVYGGKVEIVKLITDAGADPNEKYKVGATDQNLLLSLNGTPSPSEKITYLQTVAKPFAALGVSFPDRMKNAKESDYTPTGDIAKYLIEKGADPSQKVAGTWGTMLFQATEFNKTGVVIALINAKANLEGTGKIKGTGSLYAITPLMMAALKGNNELVEAFCKAGANVNFIATATDYGAEKKVGYSVQWKTTKKNTAVSLANDNGHPDTVELLRKYGGLGPKEIKK